MANLSDMKTTKNVTLAILALASGSASFLSGCAENTKPEETERAKPSRYTQRAATTNGLFVIVWEVTDTYTGKVYLTN